MPKAGMIIARLDKSLTQSAIASQASAAPFTAKVANGMSVYCISWSTGQDTDQRLYARFTPHRKVLSFRLSMVSAGLSKSFMMLWTRMHLAWDLKVGNGDAVLVVSCWAAYYDGTHHGSGFVGSINVVAWEDPQARRCDDTFPHR
jgi:hypothetical protein